MRYYKLRKIQSQRDNYAIQVPRDIAVLFKEVKFKVEISGNSLIFISGNNPLLSKEELENYHYENCITV